MGGNLNQTGCGCCGGPCSECSTTYSVTVANVGGTTAACSSGDCPQANGTTTVTRSQSDPCEWVGVDTFPHIDIQGGPGAWFMTVGFCDALFSNVLYFEKNDGDCPNGVYTPVAGGNPDCDTTTATATVT